jgi:hypothetical protein
MGTGALQLAAASIVMMCLLTSGASAQNFYELSQKKGCESVMASHRSECVDLNNKKELACKSASGTCDLARHMEQIAEYKADVERLNRGEIAEADRESFKARIEKTRAELDQRKRDAEANERSARGCADARQAVYDFFDDDVIPDTERAAADAKKQRETLLDELDATEVLQASARSKRDELAGASPETDRARYDEHVRMQAEYEKHAAAYRDSEKKLADFNQTYGKDIDHDLKGLLDYYKEEQEGHKIAIEEQKNRSENCAKVEYLSY